ncbi:MAG TPA: hypothetical protein VGG25_10300 [Streptosporangiaceae bacterium]|jgi:hypothetical protein
MAAPARLAGLSPAISPVVITDPGAPPEVVHGGPASKVHGQPEWENPFAYPWIWQSGVEFDADADYDPRLIGAPPGELGTGSDASLYSAPTETGSHAAPWPEFSVADGAVNDIGRQADRALANADLHALDSGDADARTTVPPVTTQMPWGTDADYVSAGETILQGVPGQMQGQMGRDRVQGTPPLNEYGFDSAHVRRPRAHGDVPGNFLWLDGSQRPMIVQPAGRQTWPVGQGSPFEGQDHLMGIGSVDGAVLTGLPSDYQPPPEPPTAPAAADDGPPAWSSWGTL